MEILDENLVDTPKEKVEKKPYLPIAFLLIMLIGGFYYFKFLNSVGIRGSLFQSLSAAVILFLLCLLINVVTVLIGRIFSREKDKLSIKTKAFWLERITGTFVNWCIIIGLIIMGG